MRPRFWNVSEEIFGGNGLKKASAAALASQPEYAEEGGTGEIRPLRKRKRCGIVLQGKETARQGKRKSKERTEIKRELILTSGFLPLLRIPTFDVLFSKSRTKNSYKHC